MLTDRSVLFFFSSRRRHTRWTGDWSSDVCSSDLIGDRKPYNVALIVLDRDAVGALGDGAVTAEVERAVDRANAQLSRRSEERRVGKECRSRWSPDDYKKNRESVRGGVSECEEHVK